MPCCYKVSSRKYGNIGIWKITETAKELKSRWQGTLPEALPVHPRRQSEWLASRLLLQVLAKATGLEETTVCKTAKGAPYLLGSGYGCAISHDWPYAAAMLQCSAKAGIDIAALDAQALQVRTKFLSKEELSHCHSKDQATLYWAAKEAAYKYTGGKVQDFKAMQLQPSKLQKSGQLQMQLGEELLSVGYFCMETHVVAYVPIGAAPLPGPIAQRRQTIDTD